MQTLIKITRWINTACAIGSEVLVFLLMLMVTFEIIGRHIFDSPIPGHVETATLSLVLILYLGIAYTQWENGHIRVDIFLSRVEGLKREALEVLILFLCLIPSVLIAWATAQKAWSSVAGQEFVTGAVNFPVWPGRCSVSFGFALLALTLMVQMLQHCIAILKARKKDKENNE